MSTGDIMERRTKRSTIRGFTLIELMIVVAVIAILAAIAYPSYADSVRKGRRGQAKTDLLEVAQLLERYRTVNNSYQGFEIDAYEHSPRTGTSYYDVSLGNLGVSTYTLTATPTGAQQEDKRCMALSINQAGVKSASGATGSASECW